VYTVALTSAGVREGLAVCVRCLITAREKGCAAAQGEYCNSMAGNSGIGKMARGGVLQ